MILGRFQHVPCPDFSDAPPYVAVDARPELEPRVTRRHLMTGLAGLGFGAAVAATVPSLLGRADTSPGAATFARRQGAPVDVSKLPDWARDMLEKPPEHLIYNAGVYEMKGARAWRDRRLVPCFERLLDVAIETSSKDADAVGACAARALGRFGDAEYLTQRLGAILARPELESTKDAALRVIETVHRMQQLDTMQDEQKKKGR